MKKAIIVLLTLAAASFSLSAQAAASSTTAAAPAAEVGSPDPNKVGIETAQQKLKEVSVDQFEAAGFWGANISSDEGIVTGRLFEGKPASDKPIADDPKYVAKYVFGLKTEFYARGYNDIFVSAQRPIPIEGISKIVSVWVIGRNYNHMLWLELKDFFGNSYELPMGKLNFQGWKQLSVAIPPQNPDGRSGIVQRNFHYASHMGLRVVGFRIQCDPEEAFGTYYIYFDDLRAVTDLFAEEMRDTDDMPDTW
jgi:hypothetical protein